jgi:uncharacterized protein (DUF4415 family)
MSEPATKKKHSDDPAPNVLEQVAGMADENIDTGDIPEITDAQWATAQKGRYFRPTKTSVTIRLDSDLVDWFKTRAETGGYQTDINRVLRRHMLETIKSRG